MRVKQVTTTSADKPLTTNQMSTPMVIQLSAIAEEHGELVGSKSLSLGLLSEAGFPVPKGFTLTRCGYDRAVDVQLGSQIKALLAEHERTGDGEIATIRRLVTESPLPDGIRDTLLQAYRRTFSKRSYVAVRSSGTKEDLQDASFAGQYDTILNVGDELELEQAVKQCWASIYSESVMRYADERAGGFDNLSMAVVVQEMVDADVAGVLFTVNPLTGIEDEVLIESVFGLGEPLVSGRLNADRFVLDRQTRETTQAELAAQPFKLTRGADGSTREEALTEAEGQKPSLTDNQRRELANVATRIQEFFGQPMDIEWAFSAGRLHILQARPITTLTFAPELGEWTTADFRDGGVSSDVCCPMMASLYRLAFQVSMPAYLRSLRLLGRNEEFTWIRLFFARPYWNVGATKQVMCKVPGFNERNFDTDLGIEPTYEGDGRTTPMSLAGIARALPVLFALKREYRRCLERNRAYTEAFVLRKACFDIDDAALAQLDYTEFNRRFQVLVTGFYRQTETQYFTTIYNTSNAKLDFKVLFDRVNRLAGGELNLLNLMIGLRDLSHIRPIKDMHERLAPLAGSGEPIGDELVASFAEAWPHHCRRELDIRVPRWRNDHEHVREVLESCLATLDSELHPTAREDKQFAMFGDEVARSHEALRGRPILRRRFDRALARVRTYAWWREEMRDHSSFLYYLIHKWCLEAGRRLAKRGVLGEIGDIWYLEYEQLLDTLSGDLDASGSRAAVDEGRRRLQANRRFQNPNEIGSAHSFETSSEPSAVPDGALQGTGCSPGATEGLARVICDVKDLGLVESGEILVTVYTDTGWTSVFARLGGVVTETGGVLSHAAVISREYGIPAILALPDATRRICTGDLIAVDGSRGTVEIVEPVTNQPVASQPAKRSADQ